jgi:hypothetical protein
VACEALVERLRPLAATLGEDYTWQQLVAKVMPVEGGFQARVAIKRVLLDDHNH